VITLDHLRTYAVSRSLFAPTTLDRALETFGFVQADPIRAPARAQDLILYQRVEGYRAGDLERHYESLAIEEDVFVNYGFVTRSLQALMHPRTIPIDHRRHWAAARRKKAQLLLDFVRERGVAHPREVDAHFAHGSVENWFGGSSNATTQLLDAMHYRGMLRVARRENGIRVYAPQEHGPSPTDVAARIDAMVDIAVRIYAPLPSKSLTFLLSRIRHGTPQWHSEIKSAVQRAKQRLAHARVDGLDWYWPADENPQHHQPPETVRLLTPFDPIVWDRARFEILWGWAYRFEAYTPAPKRKLGYYALPLLWRDRVIGWGNLSGGKSEFGYMKPARDRAFKRELSAEMDRMQKFLEPRP
jgi:uncharacterized protein YcaQ